MTLQVDRYNFHTWKSSLTEIENGSLQAATAFQSSVAHASVMPTVPPIQVASPPQALCKVEIIMHLFNFATKKELPLLIRVSKLWLSAAIHLKSRREHAVCSKTSLDGLCNSSIRHFVTSLNCCKGLFKISDLEGIAAQLPALSSLGFSAEATPFTACFMPLSLPQRLTTLDLYVSCPQRSLANHSLNDRIEALGSSLKHILFSVTQLPNLTSLSIDSGYGENPYPVDVFDCFIQSPLTSTLKSFTASRFGIALDDTLWQERQLEAIRHLSSCTFLNLGFLKDNELAVLARGIKGEEVGDELDEVVPSLSSLQRLGSGFGSSCCSIYFTPKNQRALMRFKRTLTHLKNYPWDVTNSVFFVQMQVLTFLVLNRISVQNPEVLITALAECPQLTVLGLNHPLTDEQLTSCLENLKKLRKLAIESNELTSLDSFLHSDRMAHLRVGLQELYLYNCTKLHKFSWGQLSKFRELTHLEIYDSCPQISLLYQSKSDRKFLPKLKCLVLSRHGISFNNLKL